MIVGQTYDWSQHSRDPNPGDRLTHSMPETRSGVTITSSGLMNIGASAANTAGYCTVRATDSTGRFSDWRFYLTVTGDPPATFYIPSTLGTFDGRTAYTPVGGGAARTPRGGDVIEIQRGTGAGGTRGPLVLSNLSGTASNPITVRGDRNGLVTIRRSSPASGGFIISVTSPRYVNLDFYNALVPEERYCGVKSTYSSSGADAPSAFIKIGDSTYGAANLLPSAFTTLRYLSVDGGWSATNPIAINGIGISVNDHNGPRYSENQINGVPTLYRESITIERCWVRNTEGEGLYIGPNWRNTTPDVPTEDDLPLRNIIIRHNLVENTGWDMCNCKSWISGDNRIHNNVFVNGSQAQDPVQNGGITANNCSVKIYSNWVENTGNPGIQCYQYQMPDTLPFGTFQCEVYNNVVCNLFNIAGAQVTKGLSCGYSAGSLAVRVNYYNNTVVNTPGDGISYGGVSGGNIHNNLCVGTDGISVGAASSVSNLVTTATAARFVDYANKDYHLQSTSPARNAATGALVPAVDYDGVARPQGASPDIGAFEYQ